MNTSDETLTDYSFLSRYHYTKSKNYLKKTISNSSLNSHVYWDTLYSVAYIGGVVVLLPPPPGSSRGALSALENTKLKGNKFKM